MPERISLPGDAESAKPESSEASRPERARITKAEMARRLRETPAFRALFEVLKGSPDVFDEIRAVLERKEEFVAGAQKEGRSNRALTALFAGINLSERGGALLDETIQRKVESDREYLVEQIRQGKNYSPELVIGTGPESVIYNSERFAFLPGDPALTVDKEKKIAGLWGPIFKAVWDLNSRTRPKNVDLPNLPGTEGSLNDLGETVLQQSDIEGLAYGSQDKLRKAIETDHAVMSVVANEIEVVKVRRNRTGARGLYEVDLLDKVNGETLKFYTDRAVGVTGLGTEISGLDESDEETANILEEERAVAEAGGDAKLYTLPEFVKKMGDKEDPFPIRGWKKVVATGPNDSGRIAAGIVLGYETQLGKTVSQLDRVESLDWIGQTLSSKEEVQRCERLRYAVIGVEFPREADKDYYHRINPKAGRAVRIRRDGENIQVIYQLYETDSEGRVVVDEETGRKKIKTGSDGRPVEEVSVGDHVILNNGFMDRTDEIFAPLNNETIEDPEQISQRYLDALASPGTVFYMKDGRTIEITSVDDNRTEYILRFADPDGRQVAVRGEVGDDALDLVSPDKIRLIELANGGVPERQFVYENDLEEGGGEIFRGDKDVKANLERALGQEGARIFVSGREGFTEVLEVRKEEGGTFIVFGEKAGDGSVARIALSLAAALAYFSESGVVESLEVPRRADESKTAVPAFEVVKAEGDLNDRLLEAATTVGTVFVYAKRSDPIYVDDRVANIEILSVVGDDSNRTITYKPRFADGNSPGIEIFNISGGRRPLFLINGAVYPPVSEIRIPQLQSETSSPERTMEVTDPTEIKRRLKTLPVVAGAKAYFKKDSVVRSLEVLRADDDGENITSSCVLTFSDGNTSSFRFESPSLGKSTPEEFSAAFLGRLDSFGVVDLVERITVPASPIAARYKNEEIYFAGPSSKLPLTEAEINRAPVLGSIKENVAAIFRYSSYVSALSRGLAKRDLKRTEVPPNVAASRPELKIVELPKPASTPDSEMILPLDMGVRERRRAIPPNFSAADFIKLAAAIQFYEYRFPRELQEIVLEARPLSDSEKEGSEVEGKIALEARVKPELPDEYMKPLYRFLRDEVVEKVLLQYTDRSMAASGRVEIRIPILNGKVDAAGVNLRSLRGTRTIQPEVAA